MRIPFRRLTPSAAGLVVFALWLSAHTMTLFGASPPAAAPPKETPISPAGPAPASAPASVQPAEGGDPGRLATLIDIVNLLKRCCYDLLDPARSAPPAERRRRAEESARLIGAARDRLQQIDNLLKSDEAHWTWVPVNQAPLDDPSGQMERFVIDPPVDNASAIAFRCRKDSVAIASIKVIDSHGAATVFPIGREYSSGERQRDVRYLYYPAAVSTILVEYANRGGAASLLDMCVGVTDLPEYAKEAIYWHRLALQELEKGELEKASQFIKRAIVNVALYRESRNRL